MQQDEKTSNWPLPPRMSKYGTPTGFGYSSRTSDNTQSGIPQVTTHSPASHKWQHSPASHKGQHTVRHYFPWHFHNTLSTPSRSITADLLWRYACCLQELLISSILQNFMYIFSLIPEFRRWADCPVPSQVWRLVVTHGTRKQITHSRFPWSLAGNVGRQFRGSAKGCDLGISSSGEEWAHIGHFTHIGHFNIPNSCWTASFCSRFMPLKVRWKLISTKNLLMYKYNNTMALHRFSVRKLEQ